MPKLLQLDSCLGIGSTGRIAETIGRLASFRGWECYMAHGSRYVGASVMADYQATSKIDEYSHFAQSILFDAHGLGSKRATYGLIDWIKDLSPNVIHLHGIHGYWLNYEVLFRYLRDSKIPVVWTFHDSWAMTGHCAIFPSLSCEKWKTLCDRCPSLKSYPQSLFLDCSRRNYLLKKSLFTSVPNLTIVSVSNWLNSVVDQSFMKRVPHVVIPNGIDLKVFYPRTESVNRIREHYGFGNKVVVVSVADKWNEGIGLSDISKLRLKLDDRFIIVLVGVTQQQRRSLPEGVVGLLHTSSRDELAELYTAADISFMPQTIATFGLVAVESMACGTPVVAYAPAAAEVIGNNGFVVPAKDTDKLADTIIGFVENGGKDKYSANCIKRVHDKYDESVNYNRYIDLFERIIVPGE